MFTSAMPTMYLVLPLLFTCLLLVQHPPFCTCSYCTCLPATTTVLPTLFPACLPPTLPTTTACLPTYGCLHEVFLLVACHLLNVKLVCLYFLPHTCRNSLPPTWDRHPTTWDSSVHVDDMERFCYACYYTCSAILPPLRHTCCHPPAY